MNFSDYKATFFAAHTPEKLHARYQRREDALLRTQQATWDAHIDECVCKTGAFPQFDADETPLQFSETHRAIKNIGGLISDSTTGVQGPAHPATVESVDAGADWVLAKLGLGFAAMTTEQAFARKLPELGSWSDDEARWNDFARVEH